ncbi:MAG: monovalent cation/H(+) antiporter subunit G [Solirubrobacteraceae bacterium]
MNDVLSGVLLFAGVALLLMCAAGVLAMHTTLDRLHYASAAGWGALLVALAILVHESFSLIGDKALATAAVMLVSGPGLGHATARALQIRRHGSWEAHSADGGSELQSGRSR